MPQLAIEGSVARLSLAAPGRHNALSLEDLAAFAGHLERVRHQPGLRTLVLSASGRSFCSGHNLAHFDPDRAATVPPPHEFEAIADAIEALPVPTVCALQGSVYAGGIDLALACDFRIGVSGMVAGMPAARIGIHLYPGALRRYAARLAPGLARRLCLLGATVPADELLRGFFLDALVAPDALVREGDATVAPLLANAPIAVRGMKASLNAYAPGSGVEADKLARQGFLASFASDDILEGLRAAKAKRTPAFTGQ